MFMILLSAALILSFTGAVTANENEINGSGYYGDTSMGEVPVEVTLTGAYTVVLPTSITINDGSTNDLYFKNGATLNVSMVDIPGNHNLTISVASENAWDVVHETDENSRIAYWLYLT